MVKKSSKKIKYHHTSRHRELCTGKTVISYLKSGSRFIRLQFGWNRGAYYTPHPVLGMMVFFLYAKIPKANGAAKTGEKPLHKLKKQKRKGVYYYD